MEDEEEDDNLSALALRGTPPPWGGTSSDPAIAPALQQTSGLLFCLPPPSKANPVCLLLKQY